MSPVIWLFIGFATGVLTTAFLRPWLRAVSSGVFLPVGYVVGMSWRGSPARLLVDTHVALAKRGHEVPFDQVEITYLAFRSSVKNEQDLVALIEQDALGRAAPQ